MRKFLSALLATLFLVTTIPMGGLMVSAAADRNLFADGDFEAYYHWDWVTYQNTSFHYGASLHGIGGACLMGNGGWGALLDQTVSVKLGQPYRLEFWYRVLDNGFNWRLEQGGAQGLYESRWETAETWTLVTYDFVASSEWVTLNFCGSGNGIAEVAYVDDVSLTPMMDWGFDGYLENGDFEQGSLNGWTPYQKTNVTEEAACYSGYGAHLMGNGGWGALLEQTFATLPGTEYTVTFNYKINQNGFNVQLKNAYTYATLAADWFDGVDDETELPEEWPDDEWPEEWYEGDLPEGDLPEGDLPEGDLPEGEWPEDDWLEDDGWRYGELTFVADDDLTLLNICGGGNGVREDAYLDDVYVYCNTEGSTEDLVDDGAAAWKVYQYTNWDLDASYLGGYGIHMEGDGGWGALVERTLPTVPGETYYLSFWYQANQNGFNLNVRDTASNTDIQSGWYDAAEWTYVEMEFVAASGAVTLNFCGGGNGIAEDVYLDEVELYSDLDEEYPEAEIRHGDFETGSLLGWSVYQSTQINAAAAYSGEYGAFLMGSGGWGALLEQGFFTPGFTYALTFRYRVISEGFNLNLVDGITGEKIAGDWYTSTEWEEVTIEFTTLSETMRLNICGGGTGTPEVACIDDISLVCLDEEWIEDLLPTMQDAAMLQRYLNGWDVELTGFYDYDLSGTLSNRDLLILMRYLTGWEG